MPIVDTDLIESPAWWLHRLGSRLLAADRRNRLDMLDAWYSGYPPLPSSAENIRDAYKWFQESARTNFAELITEAPRDRMRPVGIRTGADGDETGDARAWDIWRETGLDVEHSEVHRMMLSLGDGYVITGRDSDTEELLITAEDPREVITEHDPRNQRRIRAALKLYRDEVQALDFAYLYLPGELHVAVRDAPSSGLTVVGGTPFDARSWDWAPELAAGDIPAGLMPVVRFRNRRGVGEFEPHLPLLRRINHGILQRMTVAALQAFRQRAIKGLPERDAAGAVVDYADVFSADPGAMWQLPEGVEMWESGQVDLTPIMNSIRSDVEHLASVTKTPMHMLIPAGENQSAEGAAKSTESLVYKVEDRRLRAGDGWSQVMSNAFRWLGEDERADPFKLSVIWAPAERYSLAERYDAAVKGQAAGVPWRTIMIDILQMDPQQVDRMAADRVQDAVMESLRAPVVPPAAETAAVPGDSAPV